MLTLVRQYVIFGDKVWESEYEEEEHSEQPPYKIEEVSRRGPKWGPNISVDVIAEVRDSKNRTSYYIECKNVHVDQTF